MPNKVLKEPGHTSTGNNQSQSRVQKKKTKPLPIVDPITRENIISDCICSMSASPMFSNTGYNGQCSYENSGEPGHTSTGNNQSQSRVQKRKRNPLPIVDPITRENIISDCICSMSASPMFSNTGYNGQCSYENSGEPGHTSTGNNQSQSRVQKRKRNPLPIVDPITRENIISDCICSMSASPMFSNTGYNGQCSYENSGEPGHTSTGNNQSQSRVQKRKRNPLPIVDPKTGENIISDCICSMSASPMFSNTGCSGQCSDENTRDRVAKSEMDEIEINKEMASNSVDMNMDQFKENEELKTCGASLKRKKGQFCKSKPGKDGLCWRHSKEPRQQEDTPVVGNIVVKTTMKELREIAKKEGFKGYSRKPKGELVKLIETNTAHKFTCEEVFTKKELKTIAKRRGITNYSRLGRADLTELVKKNIENAPLKRKSKLLTDAMH
ncbi:unnamed protein product [Mytilus edulis]|uniref:Rho termination factor N-terminal domain-containing protein n=1 Tax=Mytilus edulis TaxID=6550 RepID=A0A8S3RHM9_MYTED|nr:unnamed protein product [Mytilus edulis]